jgi:hypothetical protein
VEAGRRYEQLECKRLIRVERLERRQQSCGRLYEAIKAQRAGRR